MVGAKKLDGFTIYPGQKFSCNAHLAPWTEANGWYNAGTIVGSKVEDSLGGGICQVASTLYNALLRAAGFELVGGSNVVGCNVAN